LYELQHEEGPVADSAWQRRFDEPEDVIYETFSGLHVFEQMQGDSLVSFEPADATAFVQGIQVMVEALLSGGQLLSETI
jgi:hypothetical protein